jgi:hypothetical protein
VARQRQDRPRRRDGQAAAEVERFAAEDPYVLAELVTEQRIVPIALV